MSVTLNQIPGTLQEFRMCPQMDLFQAGKHLCHVPVCIAAIHKDREAGRRQ